MGQAPHMRVLCALALACVLRPGLARAGYTVQLAAGTGSQGCSGDGGASTSAHVGRVRGFAFDASGRLVVADTECEDFRRIDLSGGGYTGTITTIAGSGQCKFADGALASAGFQPGSHGNFGLDKATGKIYTTDSGPELCNGENHRVRVIDLVAGVVSTLAGNGSGGNTGDGGPASAALVNAPHASAFANGKLYFTDTGNNRVRVIDIASGNIYAFAGTGTRGFAGDGGAATNAKLDAPHGVAVDSVGNVFICDDGNNRLRKVDTAGNVTTVAGTGVTTFNEGTPLLATSANLNGCSTIGVDQYDNLYIAEFNTNYVFKINRQGILAVIAGTGAAGDTGTGGNAMLATFNGVNGMAIDASENVYFADQNNYKVKVLVKANTAPTANAGPTQIVYEGAAVTLNGLLSSDPEDDSLTFAWTQTGGTGVTLSNATAAQPTFIAPAGPATLTFSLVVKDDQGLMSTAATTTVYVAARDQVQYLWRSSTSTNLAAQNTSASTTGGTQLHLRLGIQPIGQAWAMQSYSPTGETKGNLETLTGTYANLGATDGSYEVCTEGTQGQVTAFGTNTSTNHEWSFGGPGVPLGPPYDVCVVGETTGEIFNFGWSATATPRYPGWQVTSLALSNQCFGLSADGFSGGTLNLFATDTDRTNTDTVKDSLTLDSIKVVPRGRRVGLERATNTTFTGAVQVGTSELWTDGTMTNGSVLATAALSSTTVKEVEVQSRPSLPDNQTTIPAGGQGEWDFAIVAPNTAGTYYYRLVITDELGNRVAPVERDTAIATLVVGAGLCGNGTVDAGEQCDTGGTDTATCNGGTCKTSTCGDGYVNAAAGETCDSSGTDTATCNGGTCTTSTCGDGYTNAAAGEQCDSSGTDRATCNATTCELSRCGDGYTNTAAGEQCDGGGGDTDTCDANCTLAMCGDLYVNAIAGEQCDVGSTDTATCNATTCKTAMCGDGYANAAAGEQCDSQGVDSATCIGATCQTSKCGDGYINAAAGETCETTVDTQTCDSGTCAPPVCGDGHANMVAGEECDSAGVDSASCVGATCKLSTCGDGYVNAAAGEDCDSMGVDTATCTATCTASTCGDGYINTAAGEECDPGSTSTDACSTQCKSLAGYKLGGGCGGCNGADAGGSAWLVLVVASALRRKRRR